MMSHATTPTATPPKPEDARELQARLYRDIGISAVAAALRFTKLPEPGKPVPGERQLPAGLRDHLAA